MKNKARTTRGKNAHKPNALLTACYDLLQRIETIMERENPTMEAWPESENWIKQGVAYANERMKESDMKDLYTRGITNSKTTGHQVALSDFLVPPTIHNVFQAHGRGRWFDFNSRDR